jgi:hypothetical protein
MRAHTIAYDGRSTNDARIAEMIDHCVPASGTILALPAEADLPFLADRREAYPYLWGHEITEIHGAQQRLVQTIAAHPALVAIYPDDPWLVQSAAVETALHGEHQVAVVGGVRLLAPSGPSACWREALRFRR